MSDEQGRWPGYRVDLEAFDRLAGELPEVPGLRALFADAEGSAAELIAGAWRRLLEAGVIVGKEGTPPTDVAVGGDPGGELSLSLGPRSDSVTVSERDIGSQALLVAFALWICDSLDRLADPDRTRKWGIAARFGLEEAE